MKLGPKKLDRCCTISIKGTNYPVESIFYVVEKLQEILLEKSPMKFQDQYTITFDFITF